MLSQQVESALNAAAVIARSSINEEGNDGELLIDLGITYRALGREEEARRTFAEVVDFIQPSLQDEFSTTIATLFENDAEVEGEALVRKWRQFAETVSPKDSYRALSNVVSSLTLVYRYDEALEVADLIQEQLYPGWLSIPIYAEKGDIERVHTLIADLHDPRQKADAWISAAKQFADDERTDATRDALGEALALATLLTEEGDLFFHYKVAETQASLGDLEIGLSLFSQHSHLQFYKSFFRYIQDAGLRYLTRTRRFTEALALEDAIYNEDSEENDGDAREARRQHALILMIDEMLEAGQLSEANALLTRFWSELVDRVSVIADAMTAAGQLADARALLTRYWNEVDKTPDNYSDLAVLMPSLAKAGLVDEAASVFAGLYRIPIAADPREWAGSVLGVITDLARAGLIDDPHLTTPPEFGE